MFLAAVEKISTGSTGIRSTLCDLFVSGIPAKWREWLLAEAALGVNYRGVIIAVF